MLELSCLPLLRNFLTLGKQCTVCKLLLLAQETTEFQSRFNVTWKITPCFTEILSENLCICLTIKKKPVFTMSPSKFIRISKKFLTIKFGWLLELIKILFFTFSLEGNRGAGCFDYATSCLKFKQQLNTKLILYLICR